VMTATGNDRVRVSVINVEKNFRQDTLIGITATRKKTRIFVRNAHGKNGMVMMMNMIIMTSQPAGREESKR